MRYPDSKQKKLVLAAVLTGIALALSLVDTAISSLIPVLPGFKLGLASIVSLFALYYMGLSWSLSICAARCLLAGLLSGNLTMTLFSLGGGIVSILVMWAFMRRLSIIKVSVLGGVSHNAMQVLVAVLLTATPQAAYYLPILTAAGCAAGFFMGLVCELIFSRIRFSPRSSVPLSQTGQTEPTAHSAPPIQESRKAR